MKKRHTDDVQLLTSYSDYIRTNSQFYDTGKAARALVDGGFYLI